MSLGAVSSPVSFLSRCTLASSSVFSSISVLALSISTDIYSNSSSWTWIWLAACRSCDWWLLRSSVPLQIFIVVAACFTTVIGAYLSLTECGIASGSKPLTGESSLYLLMPFGLRAEVADGDISACTSMSSSFPIMLTLSLIMWRRVASSGTTSLCLSLKCSLT